MPTDQDRELMAQAARVEALLGEIEALPDPAVREQMAEIVTGLLTLYGGALARMLEHVRAEGGAECGGRILSAFTRDDLVSHLLLLHDLHPVGLETRVEQALEDVRPLLETHGRSVACVGVEDGVAHLRVQGAGGCPSTAAKLNSALEQAVLEAAPELAEIVTESAVQEAGRGFVPLAAVR